MLKARLTQALYDSLSPDLRKEYRKEGDAYLLDVEAVDGFSLEKADGLRSALQTERQERENLKNSMKAFDGLDPVTIREKLMNADKLLNDPNTRNLSDAQKKSLIEQLEEKFANEKKPLLEENTFYKAQVEKHLKENTAMTAIMGAKGNAKLLLPHVLPNIKVEKVDGNLVARVVDSNGQVRISKKSGSSGENMSINEFVEGLRNESDYASCFEANAQSGGGKPSNSGNSGAGGSGQYHITREMVRQHTPAEQVRAAAAKVGAPVTYE